MDQATFKLFYNKTAKPLWAYIFRICGDSHIAEDIVQEAYLRFLQNPSQSKQESQMKSYLYTIATRINFDRWRHRKQVEKQRSHSHDEHHKLESLDDKIGLKVDMAEFFKELKPQERALVWLAYAEEQTHRDIAAILDIKEKSVRVLLFRARKKLADILTKKGFAEALP